MRTELILFKTESKELDTKNEKFFEEFNNKIVRFKVDLDENLNFIDQRIKGMS